MLCVSARLGVVALLELQRPEQREQLQWPVRPHLCGGGVRSKRPMAADTASARRAQRGNRRTGTSGCRFDAVPRCAAFVALVALLESATHLGCSARCHLALN